VYVLPVGVMWQDKQARIVVLGVSVIRCGMSMGCLSLAVDCRAVSPVVSVAIVVAKFRLLIRTQQFQIGDIVSRGRGI